MGVVTVSGSSLLEKPPAVRLALFGNSHSHRGFSPVDKPHSNRETVSTVSLTKLIEIAPEKNR
jgi:hypothetical protein